MVHYDQLFFFLSCVRWMAKFCKLSQPSKKMKGRNEEKFWVSKLLKQEFQISPLLVTNSQVKVNSLSGHLRCSVVAVVAWFRSLSSCGHNTSFAINLTLAFSTFGHNWGRLRKSGHIRCKFCLPFREWSRSIDWSISVRQSRARRKINRWFGRFLLARYCGFTNQLNECVSQPFNEKPPSQLILAHLSLWAGKSSWASVSFASLLLLMNLSVQLNCTKRPLKTRVSPLGRLLVRVFQPEKQLLQSTQVGHQSHKCLAWLTYKRCFFGCPTRWAIRNPDLSCSSSPSFSTGSQREASEKHA